MRGMMSGRRQRHGVRRGARRARAVKWVCMALLFAVAIVTAAGALLRLADRRMLPVAVAVAGEHIKARTNAVYQAALEKAVASRSLVSTDFYTKTVDADGRVMDISVNTILVNAICAELAVSISEVLAAEGAEAVDVPLGLLLGVHSLANRGPRCRIRIRPMGGVQVDYESSFTSAGVNQVNFQIWLCIESSVGVVNPLQQAEIKMSRRVPLVNTVFAGQMPAVVMAPGE